MGEAAQDAIVEFRVVSETLFLTFLILKLTNVITWSWWWVCSPLLIVGGLILFFLISIIIIGLNEKRRKNKTVSESD